MDCDVEGSNPSRFGGNSVGRVHKEMAKPVRFAVQIRSYE